MERTLISDLKENIGKEILIQGWVQDIRDLGKIKFLVLRDRSGDIQAVALKDADESALKLIEDLTPESVVSLTGMVKENAQSRWGVEIVINNLELISKAETPLPIDNSDKSQTSLDKRLDYRFLDTRNKKHNAIFKLRSKIAVILTNFFDANGFTNINTPKITTIGVESGAELFEMNYFGKPAYLAQSPQIYKQMFVTGGFERVYEIGTIFRAEKSHTTRHLTEFTGVDFEMGFIKDETDIMDLIENMFVTLLTKLKEETSEELKLLDVEHNIPKKIPRITMKEAKKLIAEKGKILKDDDDLDSEGERLLGEIVKEKYGEDFVFVTKFPWAVRPFYHMRSEGSPDETNSFDLLYNGVEICTGAQREHRLEVLKAQAKEKGIDFGAMTKYEEIFRFGIPPHGGVGFGLDRITYRLLKLNNVREVTLLPRDPERLAP